MSYRVGIGGGMARLGFVPNDPHIVCDGCGTVRRLDGQASRAPPAWFLSGKPPPGWSGTRSKDGTSRTDYCPRCKTTLPLPKENP
jgi:hypothetical protein